MRTTVTLDDALLLQAQNLSGLKDRGVLLKEALRALIERESARPAHQAGRHRAPTQGHSSAPGTSLSDPGKHLSLDRSFTFR